MARQRATTTAAIIEAAARVFERKGFNDATMDEIALEAGVSKPTLYQYAESKQWLLETMCDRVLYFLEERSKEITTADAEPLARLQRYIEFSVLSATRFQTYYSVTLSDHTSLSPQGRERFRVWARHLDSMVHGLLVECAADGVVREDIDLRVATNLLNQLVTSVHRWYRPSGRLTPAQIADECGKFLGGFIVGSPVAASAAESAEADERALPLS